MKAKLKTAMFTAKGLFKKGDIIEVDKIDPILMIPIEDEPEEIEEPKPKKTAKSKK